MYFKGRIDLYENRITIFYGKLMKTAYLYDPKDEENSIMNYIPSQRMESQC
jgi:hypothetical protein